MKKNIVKIFALILTLSLCFTLASCEFLNSLFPPKDDTIYVGNTAGTTGALATIGVPFNLGIEAAFAAYNAKGGFNGRKVALKHYDDEGVATNSTSLMEKLIHEDEVFAIVGNYGGYAVNVNLDMLKENQVPMIYAAAGNDALYNENATSAEDKVIFPVQPLYITEGRSLILRAFGAAFNADYSLTGSLGATKVGVLYGKDEGSVGMVAGIRMEAENLPEAKKNNIVYSEVNGTDYLAAAQALVNAGCDSIIVTITGVAFVPALTALVDAGYVAMEYAGVTYKKNVLTTYSNASASALNDAVTTLLTENGSKILSNLNIYAQGWLDISGDVLYNEDTPLVQAYKNSEYGALYADGIPNFSAEYWVVAENIYNYAASLNDTSINAWAMSYNSFALAGYIAGDLFCQGLAQLQAEGKELTRENYVAIMESKEFKIAMSDMISYTNGARTGVENFSVSLFFDVADYGYAYHSASSVAVCGLKSLDELRALVGE